MSESLKILKEYCFKLISRREYSVGMIRKKLREKFPAASSELVKEVLDYLAEYEFVSDERYTEIYVRTKAAAGWGKTKIAFKLKQNGLDKDLVSKYLERIEDQTEIVADLVDRKFSRLISLEIEYDDRQKLKNKVYRFLAQKGFSYDQIKKELTKLDLPR
jgi:regulatory protein